MDSPFTEKMNLISFVVLGDSGSGKTSLSRRYCKGTFESFTSSTISADFFSKTIMTKNGKTNVRVWDTAGAERFKSLTYSYIRSSHAAILVYDVTDRNSFDGIDEWCLVLRRANEKAPVFVVGNKRDKTDNTFSVVSEEEVNKKCERIGAYFFEASAKNGYNVDTIFDTIARKVITLEENEGNHNLSVESTAGILPLSLVGGDKPGTMEISSMTLSVGSLDRAFKDPYVVNLKPSCSNKKRSQYKNGTDSVAPSCCK